MLLLVLIAIGIAIACAVAFDPYTGISVALAVAVLFFTVTSRWVVIALLLALTPFGILWTPLGISAPEVAYSMTFLLLLLCWAVRSVTDLAVHGEIASVHSPLAPPLYLLFAATLLSAGIAVKAGRPFAAWGSDMNLISFYALYFVVVGSLQSIEELNKIFRVLLVVSVFAAIRGVFYRLTIDPQTIPVIDVRVPKITMASSISLLMLTMTLPFALLVQERQKRFFWGMAAAFFSLMLILSFVRSKWLGALAAIAFLFFVLTPPRKARFFKYGILAFALFAIYVQVCIMVPFKSPFLRLPAIIEARFSTIFNPHDEPTAVTRFSEWNAVMKKIARHPIRGNGLGTEVTYTDYSSLRKPTVKSRYIHNSYLYFYMNTGLLGLCAILWLVGAFVWYGIRVFRSTKTPYYRAFALGCVTTFVAFAVTSLIGAEISFPARTIAIGFLMGALTMIDKTQC